MEKRVTALILGLFFILNALPCAALDVNPATDRDFDVPCQAAILIDEDSGTVLYEKNADESRPIASITKVMTLLLTFEALEAGKVSLRISSRYPSTPTIWAAARSGWNPANS